MSTSTALVIEPAASWRRLQQSSEFFFEDLDAQMKEHHREFLEALMGYERQCFLNAQPYERTDQRVDQANGFYGRQLTPRLRGAGLADAAHPVGLFSQPGASALPAARVGRQRSLEASVSAGRLQAADRTGLGHAGGRSRQRLNGQRRNGAGHPGRSHSKLSCLPVRSL